MNSLPPASETLWLRFQHHRRGYWSLWIGIILFITSLSAEFIANDKPLLLSYQNKILLPLMVDYSESVFGGDFLTATDYQDPFIIQQIQQHGWAIWPPVRFSYNTPDFATRQPFPSPPSRHHILGTNDNGHDVLANILYGLKFSLLFGLILTLFSTVIGIFVGAIQGYYAGYVDLWGQRFIEIWSGLPGLILIILLSDIIPAGFWRLLCIALLFGWIHPAGVVRAAFLRTRSQNYILAARAIGANNRTIITNHLLPHASAAILAFLPFTFCGAVTLLASLDFLGFGLPQDSPSLGRLLLQGKNNPEAPWIGITAFLTVAILLCLLIFIGEAIRDACNPQRLC